MNSLRFAPLRFNMAAFLVLAMLCAWPSAVRAAAPPWGWASAAGGGDFEAPLGIAADTNGQVYVSGFTYSGMVAFGNVTLNGAPGLKMFLAKYDGTGQALWVRQATGNAFHVAASTAVDTAGNIYITGNFSGRPVFGTTTLGLGLGASFEAMFVAKYDNGGNVIWARESPGNFTQRGIDVAVDAAGNSYVGGIFCCGSLVLGGVTLTNAGQEDVFLAKFDPTGNALWAVRGGGLDFDALQAVTVDSQGNSYMAGRYSGANATFGAVTLPPALLDDSFVAKYNPAGQLTWVRRVAGDGYDTATGVGADAAGNVYVSGWFTSASLQFGGVTVTNRDPTGGGVGTDDIFLVKYDGGGSALWARSGGGADVDDGNDLAVDAAGNSFITGYFYSPTADFGVLRLTNQVAATISQDFFVVKHDSAGNPVWAASAGNEHAEYGASLALDPAGSAYVTGGFGGATTVIGSFTLTNAASDDIFVAKLGTPAPILKISLMGADAVVRWPAASGNFDLLSASHLAPGSQWSLVTNRVDLVGADRVVVIGGLLNGNRFFRLRQQ